ncbi:MAG: ABC transporter ATP-binding protein [Armatimonadetes bacterium]|nr:ABC transporter ATP-binding protein [Armatimonadota bacterium]
MAEAPPSNEVVIRTENLSKTYRNGAEQLLRMPGVTALSNLNMEVHRGEVFALIGPNGSGKTTTLKLLMGLIFPTSGEVEVFGSDPRTSVDVKRRIGFMPDGPYFYGHLNGYELLEFYANLLGMDRAATKQRVMELLEKLEMTTRAKQRVRTYSKGMLQRIGLAHALLQNPEIIFMDEPTSGLDPVGTADMHQMVRQMKSEGKTVFLCSHFLTEIEDLCDRVILLDRGRTLQYGDLNSLLAEPGKMRVRLSAVSAAARARLLPMGRPLAEDQAQGNLELVVADGTDTHNTISTANELGAHLDLVAPMRRTLEEVFMESIARQQADAPWQDGDRGLAHLVEREEG